MNAHNDADDHGIEQGDTVRFTDNRQRDDGHDYGASVRGEVTEVTTDYTGKPAVRIDYDGEDRFELVANVSKVENSDDTDEDEDEADIWSDANEADRRLLSNDDEPEVRTDGGGQSVEEADEEADDDTPHADEFVQSLVDRFNSHGFSRDHAEVCNDVCVWVEFSGSSHRGNMHEREVGVFQTARRLGWYPQGVAWEEDRILFRRDRDETEEGA